LEVVYTFKGRDVKVVEEVASCVYEGEQKAEVKKKDV